MIDSDKWTRSDSLMDRVAMISQSLYLNSIIIVLALITGSARATEVIFSPSKPLHQAADLEVMHGIRTGPIHFGQCVDVELKFVNHGASSIKLALSQNIHGLNHDVEKIGKRVAFDLTGVVIVVPPQGEVRVQMGGIYFNPGIQQFNMTYSSLSLNKTLFGNASDFWAGSISSEPTTVMVDEEELSPQERADVMEKTHRYLATSAGLGDGVQYRAHLIIMALGKYSEDAVRAALNGPQGAARLSAIQVIARWAEEGIPGIKRNITFAADLIRAVNGTGYSTEERNELMGTLWFYYPELNAEQKQITLVQAQRFFNEQGHRQLYSGLLIARSADKVAIAAMLRSLLITTMNYQDLDMIIQAVSNELHVEIYTNNASITKVIESLEAPGVHK